MILNPAENRVYIRTRNGRENEKVQSTGKIEKKSELK